MEKIGIVVLNYIKYEITIRCVNSLIEQQNIDIRVVIVDNGSDNDSYDRLKSTFGNVKSVELVRSEKNLGFARGMNLGIKVLRKLHFDFIFLANSDLVFNGKEILYQMRYAYNGHENVGVINPVVIDSGGVKAKGIDFSMRMTRLHMLKTFMPWIDNIRCKLGIKKNENVELYPKEAVHESTPVCTLNDRYTVMGCGYMLTPAYFRFYDGMYPDTFLYNEEYATILMLKSAGLRTMNVSTAPVLHLHGLSTPDKNTMSLDLQVKMKKSRESVTRLIYTPDNIIRGKYGRHK